MAARQTAKYTQKQDKTKEYTVLTFYITTSLPETLS